jgi:hypothetical protein
MACELSQSPTCHEASQMHMAPMSGENRCHLHVHTYILYGTCLETGLRLPKEPRIGIKPPGSCWRLQESGPSLSIGLSAATRRERIVAALVLLGCFPTYTVIGPRRCCTTLALAHLFHDALQLAQDSFAFPKLFGMGIGYGARHPCLCSLPFFFFFFF